MALKEFTVHPTADAGKAVVFTRETAKELLDAGWIDDMSPNMGIEDFVGYINYQRQTHPDFPPVTEQRVVHHGEFIVDYGGEKQVLTAEQVDEKYELVEGADA